MVLAARYGSVFSMLNRSNGLNHSVSCLESDVPAPEGSKEPNHEVLGFQKIPTFCEQYVVF